MIKNKKIGWTGFEIKKETAGLKFQYNASMFSGKSVVVDLGR